MPMECLVLQHHKMAATLCKASAFLRDLHRSAPSCSDALYTIFRCLQAPNSRKWYQYMICNCTSANVHEPLWIAVGVPCSRLFHHGGLVLLATPTSRSTACVPWLEILPWACMKVKFYFKSTLQTLQWADTVLPHKGYVHPLKPIREVHPSGDLSGAGP